MECNQQNLFIYDMFNLPNLSNNQLWLQNIIYQQDKKENKSPYDMHLVELSRRMRKFYFGITIGYQIASHKSCRTCPL